MLIPYDSCVVRKSENHRRIHDSGYNKNMAKKKLLCSLKFCYPATKQTHILLVQALVAFENANKTIPKIYQNANGADNADTTFKKVW